jgi:hypothetical protein
LLNSAQALNMSAMGHRATPGMSRRRRASSGALSDTASSVARSSCAYLRIIGATPAVDTVMREGDMPNACRSTSLRTAATTFE